MMWRRCGSVMTSRAHEVERKNEGDDATSTNFTTGRLSVGQIDFDEFILCDCDMHGEEGKCVFTSILEG